MTDQTNTTEQPNEAILGYTSDIIAAFVSNNTVEANALPEMITLTYAALAGITKPPVVEEPVVVQEPAVSIRSSIKPDYLVCLEDGKKVKMLKRYLRTNFNLSPDDYRAKWKLPADYPMVAPNYSEKRRTLAMSIGLGTKRRGTTDAVASPKAAPKKTPAKKATKPATAKVTPAAKEAAPEAIAA